MTKHFEDGQEASTTQEQEKHLIGRAQHKEELGWLRQDIQELTEQKMELMLQNTDLMRQIDELTEQKMELMGQNAGLMNQIGEFKRNATENHINGYTWQDIDRLVKENEELTDRNRELTTSRGQIIEQVAQLDKRVDDLIGNWNRDNDENRKLIDNLTRQANALYQVILKLGGYDQK